MTRYRVQVRDLDEPYRTVYAVADRAAAHRLAAQVCDEERLAGHLRWPYVRIVYGELLVSLWQGGAAVIVDPDHAEVA